MYDINKVLDWIMKEAKARRDRWDDGGAARLEQEVAAYRAGMKGNIPSNWESIIPKYAMYEDEEYKEYVRLSKKFGKKP